MQLELLSKWCYGKSNNTTLTALRNKQPLSLQLLLGILALVFYIEIKQVQGMFAFPATFVVVYQNIGIILMSIM